MPASNRVVVADLRRALSLVLDEIETRQGRVVDLEPDLYFTLPLSQMFASLPPSSDDFSTCQLADDLMETETMLQRADAGDSMTPWHDLQHLVGVLSALAAHDLPGLLEMPK